MKVKSSIHRYILYTAIISTQLASAYATNTKDHYDYRTDSTTLAGDYDVYSGRVSSSILIEGEDDGSTIVNGNGHHGFQFLKNTTATTITVKNISEFRNFEDTVDGSANTHEGGSVFYIAGGANLEFEGYDENNRLHFYNDTSSNDGTDGDGGAIFVGDNGRMGDLYADFTYNHAILAVPEDNHRIYARGGALNVGGTISTGTVGNVYGNFTGNTAEYGGAIYVGENGTIGNIGGSFTYNIATAAHKEGGTTGGSAGGAIRVYRGTIGNIHASFHGNLTHAKEGDTEISTSQGGAVALNGVTFAATDEYGRSIGTPSIKGNITENVSRSESADAYGGGFYIVNQSGASDIYIEDSHIVGNIAATDSTAHEARGGGFFIDLSDAIFIQAKSSDVLMRDNMEIVGGTWDSLGNVTGGTRDYNAIYSTNSTITLSAYNDKKITIDDSIESDNTSKLIIDSSSSQQYDVELNAEIRNMNVEVANGGLILGSYTHDPDGEKITTTADFKGGTLNIHSNGTVNSAAENLNGATSISNSGSIELTGGTLTKGINTAGTKTGSLHIQGETHIASGAVVLGDTVHLDNMLHIADDASITVNTLLYQGADMHEINAKEQIILAPDATLDFDIVRLEIDSASGLDYFDLILSDGSGYHIADKYSSDYTLEFTLGGNLLTQHIDYEIVDPGDGGLRVLFLNNMPIPEPSSTTLSLLALAALMMRRRRQ